VFQALLAPKTAKMRESGQTEVKVRAILNEIIASAMEIKCCIRTLQGKEITRGARPAAD